MELLHEVIAFSRLTDAPKFIISRRVAGSAREGVSKSG
jgi:hypothetical protein